MRLCDMPIGAAARLETVNLPDHMKQRLEFLGLADGAAVTLLRQKRGGAVIFKVRGVRYAAGRRIAEGIFVRLDGND